MTPAFPLRLPYGFTITFLAERQRSAGAGAISAFLNNIGSENQTAQLVTDPDVGSGELSGLFSIVEVGGHPVDHVTTAIMVRLSNAKSYAPPG
jgi:hypothetical protein